MVERMSTADVAFLHRESRTAPQHVGGLMIFTPPPAGFDYDRLVRLLEERIPLAPRYRQKVRMVPGNLANPVWVDDPRFDITYHVRRSALPRPGTDAQLLEFCSRIQSRLLDRGRPLWETYLVEGLAGGRVAVVTKTHEAIVNEDGIDLAQVLLDAAPEPRRTVSPVWMPEPEPTAAALAADALRAVARRPLSLRTPLRAAAGELVGAAGRVAGVAAGALGGFASVPAAMLRRPQQSPLHAELGEQRRLAVARTELADYRMVRAAFGGSVNDVVLAVVAGALRGWLLSRAEPLRPASTVRALVPMAGADGIRPLLVDLPVGEPDPVLRLAQLRFTMAGHKAAERAVSADRIAGLSGFAPPTLHALSARAAGGLARRLFNLVVTNVPGPQLPLYAAGARLAEIFPILPLAPGQAVTIALTSYDGGVFFGVNGDREAMRDVGVFAHSLEESLAELVAASGTNPVAATGPASGPRPPRRPRKGNR